MTVPASRQPTPWVVPDLFRWFGLLGVAAVGLVIAWWGASGTADAARLILWANVGVGAVVVAGLGNMTWLLQGRRAVAARRQAILATVPARDEETTADDGRRVAVAGMTRYHRPHCPAVAGKAVDTMRLVEHERAGRRPCGLCH